MHECLNERSDTGVSHGHGGGGHPSKSQTNFIVIGRIHRNPKTYESFRPKW